MIFDTLPRRSLDRSGHRALRLVGLASIAALALSLFGVVADPRLIAGAPAWLKPAKFAASIAIYSLTLAWLAGLARESRVVRWSGNAIAALFVLEWAIIALQAARGTTSHFNVATPLDGYLFRTMGIAIALVWIASLGIFLILLRTRTTDRVMMHGVRLGLALTLVGSALGGAMLRPTSAQLAESRATGRPTVSGAHTVGAPDGGAGLPVTGWSVTAGDLRIAHFVGMHAMQALPLLAWLLSRRRPQLPEATRRTAVSTAAASYAGLVGLLFWQALRGQPVVAPDRLTLIVVGAWIVASGLAARRVFASSPCSLSSHVDPGAFNA